MSGYICCNENLGDVRILCKHSRCSSQKAQDRGASASGRAFEQACGVPDLGVGVLDQAPASWDPSPVVSNLLTNPSVPEYRPSAGAG